MIKTSKRLANGHHLVQVPSPMVEAKRLGLMSEIFLGIPAEITETKDAGGTLTEVSVALPNGKTVLYVPVRQGPARITDLRAAAHG